MKSLAMFWTFWSNTKKVRYIINNQLSTHREKQ
jgi:hypothetical protein